MSLDLTFYNPKVQRWRFVVVPKGMSTLLVRREGQKKDPEPETYLAGSELWLGLNTRLLFKPDRRDWLLMFWLALHRGIPSIKYGQRYGPYPDQWRDLSRLSPGAHLNAGIDPAWL